MTRQAQETVPLSRHDATNILIDMDVDGSTATGSAFLIFYVGGPAYKVLLTGRYADKLTKTPEGWRFTQRVLSHDE